ncbi:hypothetical protein SAMN02745136_04941 [Anaerocolumna jejuensis DSM 15929]|uniref:Uncharacterized protein n=1 Tax=Anaerocolumna jejuensis DSM 15929 TaxID=1121322 RepID=A0A1M7ASM2_9FIRM|nr:hypothetical protein [Anaerocolumna jejuensis]SHL45419.1 hypothetical protein SAMN02745136_04941 [Anaerocolumna jejuensis DSM 15929]
MRNVIGSKKNSATIEGLRNLREERNVETKKSEKSTTENNQSGYAFDITKLVFEEAGYFNDNEEYYGVIQKVEGYKNVNGDKFVTVSAELEDEEGKKGVFDKYFKYELNTNSLLYRFCKNMDALAKDKKGININALVDKDVTVTLYTNDKDKTYISTIYPYVEKRDTEEESLDDFDIDEDEDDDCIYED